MNKTLNTLTRSKKRFNYNFSINCNKEVIIDFYNVYCNFINFETYKTFTKATFLSCLQKVMNTSKFSQINIVSKPIFEVNDSVIKTQTIKYKNLKYFIIVDDNNEKSLNRERDDFFCILLHYLNKESYIITNDKYSNYRGIITDIKPFTVRMFKEGNVTEIKIDIEYLEKLKKEILQSSLFVKRKNFNFR